MIYMIQQKTCMESKRAKRNLLSLSFFLASYLFSFPILSIL